MLEYKDYIFTPIENGNKTSYWISKKGNMDAYYCFTVNSSNHKEELKYQIENGFDGYVTLYETNHAKLTAEENREFNINTPLGQLHVYAKHKTDLPNNFPGVFIDLKETYDMLACVEYEHTKQVIQTCVYQPGNDEPVDIIEHNIEE